MGYQSLVSRITACITAVYDHAIVRKLFPRLAFLPSTFGAYDFHLERIFPCSPDLGKDV
jgi:hypothetical protein